MKNQRSFFPTWLPCLVALGLQLLAVPAAGAASFTNTGSMSQGHDNAAATLLPNGKVLIAGGFYHSYAEVYDPATGTWSATGNLHAIRVHHTVTLLPNGKMLAVGGSPETPNGLTTAELYDPAVGTWTDTQPGGPAIPSTYDHTATLLPNGKVLVAGGYGVVNGFRSFSMLYDPTGSTWTGAGFMSTNRAYHTATLLPNGKVLIAGGSGNIAGLSSAELYDPAGGWAATGAMGTVRFHHTATLLSNGTVLVAGGYGATNSAELYNPATGAWTPTGAMNVARAEHSATLLPNGKVLVTGGILDSTNLFSAELYDPATGTWAATATMNTGRSAHTATLLQNGKVLIASGTSAELYEADPLGQITGRLLAGGDVRLTYLGIEGANYALERTLNLLPVVNWVPQATNAAGAGGVLIFTNTPVANTNNFWRIHSVP